MSLFQAPSSVVEKCLCTYSLSITVNFTYSKLMDHNKHCLMMMACRRECVSSPAAIYITTFKVNLVPWRLQYLDQKAVLLTNCTCTKWWKWNHKSFVVLLYRLQCRPNIWLPLANIVAMCRIETWYATHCQVMHGSRPRKAPPGKCSLLSLGGRQCIASVSSFHLEELKIEI